MTGVLRGFDPFMNLVIDEAVEECKTGEKNHIGMVVCALSGFICQCASVPSCNTTSLIISNYSLHFGF